MTLRMRVLPRFPAKITGTAGITTMRDGPDIIIKSDYGSLIRIPSVANEETAFFKVWNQDNDSYSIMTFEDVIAAIGSVTGVMAVATYDPQGIHSDAFNRANHTGSQAISTVSGLQTALDGKDGKVVYAAKSANYVALLSDNNAVHRFTAAATVALPAAATLGANWHYTVVANGADVLIDPNGAETINGLPTLIVPNGTTAEIICDGAAFFTVFKPSGWTTIERRNFSGVSAVDFANLYGDLRVSGWIDLSGATSDIFWRSSTNNGAGFDFGASDYAAQTFISSATALSGTRQTTQSYGIVAGGGFSAGSFQLALENFGRSFVCSGISTANVAPSTGTTSMFSNFFTQFRNSSVARNALRIGTVSGANMLGSIKVEAFA